jgi:murein DD-endopeptidase MepM/ murein hydrolase activator NlpD
VTSPFGTRCSGVSGDFHAGIDVRTWDSKNVVAVAAGTVHDVSSWSGYDWTLILQHGSGDDAWYSGYHHMDDEDSVLVDIGQGVTEG